MAFGPDQTFTTKTDPPPPPPKLGKSFNVKPVSGLVLIRFPGTHAGDRPNLISKGQGFIPLTEARQLPSGTQVDARRGNDPAHKRSIETAQGPVRHLHRRDLQHEPRPGREA